MKSAIETPSATMPPIKYPMVALHEREIFVVVFSILDPLERQDTSGWMSGEIYVRRLLS
jgi:hypothetical protein